MTAAAVPGRPGAGGTALADGARHLAIVGATATGKTSLACGIAADIGELELVSADSMSVYRGMDLGTAKPIGPERDRAPWHLLDLVDPADEFSVAAFQSYAGEAIAGVESRGHTVVLVGGTGLYHRAVIDSLSIPGRWPAIAAELEETAGRPGGSEQLHARLAELDPEAAKRMNPTNRRRVVRALEVTVGSGRRFSTFGPGLGAYGPTPFLLVGLRLGRSETAHRLEERLDAQLAAGLLDEVRTLRGRPGGLSRTARQALGYRELLAHLEQGVPLAEARAEALRRMRRFAKRQESWFGRDPRVRWFEADRPDLIEVVAVLAAALAAGRPEAAGGGRADAVRDWTA